YYIILLIFTIPLFSSPVFALLNPSSDLTREVLCEEKTRLGSTPPSCYNKCNRCHPCKAVQVSTLPSLHRVEPPRSSQPPSSAEIFEYDSSYGGDNRYSNYKPLGWKCHCRNHFYNP
ncbi:hypothetical protein SOVF_063910, partial [Spinacia oleracea]